MPCFARVCPGPRGRVARYWGWPPARLPRLVTGHICGTPTQSKEAFTYEQAQLRIDDASKTDSLTESLRGLNFLAKKLKLKRLDAGALTLASVEVRFHLDSETADPIDLYTKELKETNSMVEEFMLLARVRSHCHLFEFTNHWQSQY